MWRTCLDRSHQFLWVFYVYSSILTNLEFKPTAHFNYENTILPMMDGLPKFKDFPEELGGSGEMIEE